MGVDVRHERVDASRGDLRGPRVRLERLVDGADVRDFAGLEGQVVTHEAIEVRAVGFLAERELHGSPVNLVELRLMRLLEAH